MFSQVIAWALYGTYRCKTFWPRPAVPNTSAATASIRWPKRAHPGALVEAGQVRAPCHSWQSGLYVVIGIGGVPWSSSLGCERTSSVLHWPKLRSSPKKARAVLGCPKSLVGLCLCTMVGSRAAMYGVRISSSDPPCVSMDIKLCLIDIWT